MTNPTKPALKPASILLTQEEGEALLALIDLAVKSRGLEVSNNACAFHQKISAAFTAAQKEEAPTE